MTRARVEDCSEMAPLLQAFARGTRRSRLRLLVAVCPQGHTLLEVFPTSAGARVLWRERQHWKYQDDSGQVLEHDDQVWTVVDLDSGSDALEDDDLVGGACRCTEESGARLSWLRSQVEQGLRRVVITMEP